MRGIPFEWTRRQSREWHRREHRSSARQLETNAADPNGQDALDYLRGDAQFSIAGGGSYRNRTHVLGDIVDSAPLYIGAPTGPYQSGSYFTFINNYKNRAPVLYVGANDGMLHAFSAATGQELFAYIPSGVFAQSDATDQSLLQPAAPVLRRRLTAGLGRAVQRRHLAHDAGVRRACRRQHRLCARRHRPGDDHERSDSWPPTCCGSSATPTWG